MITSAALHRCLLTRANSLIERSALFRRFLQSNILHHDPGVAVRRIEQIRQARELLRLKQPDLQTGGFCRSGLFCITSPKTRNA